MKKLLPLLLLILLSSCVTTRYAKYIQLPSMTDFRPYTENGFFISPGMEGVKYKPIGMISFIFSPGVTKNKALKKYASYHEDVYDAYGYRNVENPKNQDSTINDDKTKDDGFFQPNEDYMLERIVEYAKNMGATGLLNYSINYSYEMPSPISKVREGSDPWEMIKAHPFQTYGSATITAFAVEVLE